MKTGVSILLALLLISTTSFGKDVLYLTNGEKVKGELISVTTNEITFQPNKKKLDKMILSSDEVNYVKVDSYDKLLTIQNSMYTQGIADAEIYHKRFGGNFCAGFFGGIIGFVIVAVTDAKDPDPSIVGEEKFNDREYREGYNKKAKGKNMGAAGAGWAAGFVLLLLLLL